MTHTRTLLLAAFSLLAAMPLPSQALVPCNTPPAGNPLCFAGPALEVGATFGGSCVLLGTGNVRCVDFPSYGGGDAISFSAGFRHACALIAGPSVPASSNVKCWGSTVGNYDGVALAVSAGIWRDCALTKDRNVTCWGDSAAGYSRGDAVALSAEGYHACVITTLRNVQCWNGRLPPGMEFGQAAPYDSGDALALDVGYYHTCVLRTTLNVTCWGSNGSGRSNPYNGGDATAVSAGGDNTCVVARGAVKCWGWPYYGVNRGYNGAIPAIDVSTQADHACALLVTGEMTCWGRATHAYRWLPAVP